MESNNTRKTAVSSINKVFKLMDKTAGFNIRSRDTDIGSDSRKAL